MKIKIEKAKKTQTNLFSIFYFSDCFLYSSIEIICYQFDMDLFLLFFVYKLSSVYKFNLSFIFITVFDIITADSRQRFITADSCSLYMFKYIYMQIDRQVEYNFNFIVSLLILSNRKKTKPLYIRTFMHIFIQLGEKG